MSDNFYQLEFLPNEILFEIFKYFNAQDLFQSFYNLNSRFNDLLQSLTNLSLTLLTFDSNQKDNYDIFAPYVYTLFMDYGVNIDFKCFLNVRRLTLMSPTTNQLKQLVSDTLPYLEYLSVGYEHFLFSYYIPDLCYKIFSNGFPHLKSCHLLEPRLLETIPSLTGSTQLRILKMENIDIFIYKDILSLCPNLYFFQFRILSHHEEQCYIEPHHNLKRMIIKFQSLIKPLFDCSIDLYLSCVPYLEQFTVHETNFDVIITEYLDYKWFAGLIDHRLLSLRRFKYYLNIYAFEKIIKQNNENIASRIKENFQCHHKDRYQSRLVLNLSPLLT
jgi:hypothetical protein